jgi:hypothetical protein
MNDLKNKILRPATTSHFECNFKPPEKVVAWMKQKGRSGAGVNLDSAVMDKINISCFEASLPGSSLQTTNLNDTYTGVTETYAYRRAYDNRSDFTFYVDHLDNGNNNSQSYTVILFFENWLSYISGENYADGLRDPNYFYRINFFDNYVAPKIEIDKFEKDVVGDYLHYEFINAYPISIASMPVSYEGSQLLRCTVSFTYQRYLIQNKPASGIGRPPIEPRRVVAPTTPTPPTL